MPKLSELIREGAKKRPQGFNSFFTKPYRAKKVHSCALGAALEAASGGLFGYERFNGDWKILQKKTGVDFGITAFCPVKNCGLKVYLERTITHLNDSHKWTREAIADWLEKEGY